MDTVWPLQRFRRSLCGWLSFIELECYNRRSSKPLSDQELRWTVEASHWCSHSHQNSLWSIVDKASQMATNITSDGVNFLVSRMPKLEEHSTDTLVNADGESTDGVQDLLAPIVNSVYPEHIAAEIQHSVRTTALLLILSPLGVDSSPSHRLLLSIVCQ